MSDLDNSRRSHSSSPMNNTNNIDELKRNETESSPEHHQDNGHNSPDDRAKKSYSRSPSRHSRKVSYKSDERDRGGRYHSRSRSRSRRRTKYSYSRSRSYSPRDRSHSHSPMSSRRRHIGTRDNPKTSRCIGVFGLSTTTTENELYDIFSKYGPVEHVTIIIDKKTGRSRGFGFVYYENLEDAKVVKESCSGMEIDNRSIRVDYSITQRAHTPTPGIYMGKPTHTYDRSERRRDRDDYYYRDRYRDRRSPSPRYRRSRYDRSRSRSYTPHRYR